MEIVNIEEEQVSELVTLAALTFSRPWTRQNFLEEIRSENSCCLACIENKKIVGYCVFQISYETADLAIIAVKTSERKQGIAQQLFNAQVQQCKNQNVERILLEVRKSNSAAIQFYKKNGFEQIAVRKGYYSKPVEDALIMCKEIC